ncbi:MAG TPA: GvpL/GvpF family gas vesicle protein [Gemmatimonadaceae bacterium]|nr:GvpL/GvpF family gas vesicle protein [Gemmatimonadaceae bacterium]
MPNALRLFGITDAEHHAQATPLENIELLHFRDLAAIVGPAEYSATQPSGEAIEQYRRVVDDIFGKAPILPAPVGTVFRSRETLTRWLELHYITLTEALSFVEDRAVARVHVGRVDGAASERETGSDVAAAAAESLRLLRRHAVVAVPLKSEQLTGIVLSSAFLVDRELWDDFVAAVDDQRQRNPGLALDVSGPWPPFDFVRMQFGG